MCERRTRALCKGQNMFQFVGASGCEVGSEECLTYSNVVTAVAEYLS